MISTWGNSTGGGNAPALSMDFTSSDTLDPRVTFSRASNATRINAQGLVEYAPHNLEFYSQAFSNAFWDKAGGLVTVTDNFTTAPNGTLTATKWTETAGTGSHHIHDATGNFTPVVGQKYTMSMHLKQTETNPDRYVQMVFWLAGFPATAYANFDMTLGTVAFQGAGLTSATITQGNNGWYRLSISAVATATGASGWQAAFISTANAARAESYTVTAGSEESYYLWGAQVNLGGLVDYTQTTSAVAYGPRFDFDPVTLQPKGLLIEEQRTNLLTYSEQFDNAIWTKVNATITANATTAPDETLTADKLVEDTVNGAHRVDQYISKVATSSIYAFSVYVKAAGRTKLAIRIRSTSISNSSYAEFDLAAITTSLVSNFGGFSGAIASISDVGNGWIKCTITATSDTDTLIGLNINLYTTSDSYTGDGTSGVYIWGAQLEAGAFATSYIPTIGSQATRAADSAVMTGTNFSSWYRQDEGTFLAKADSKNQINSAMAVVQVSDGTVNNRIGLYKKYDNNLNNEVGIVTSSVGQAFLTQPVTLTDMNKNAFCYKINDIAFSANGLAAAIDTLATIPTVSQMVIGNGYGLSALNGHISKLAYYPRRLTNAQLQEMTA